MEIKDLNPGSPKPLRSTTGNHLPVPSLSPSLVELRCEEDMLDDDDSTCDEETQVMPSRSLPSRPPEETGKRAMIPLLKIATYPSWNSDSIS